MAPRPPAEYLPPCPDPFSLLHLDRKLLWHRKVENGIFPSNRWSLHVSTLGLALLQLRHPNCNLQKIFNAHAMNGRGIRMDMNLPRILMQRSPVWEICETRCQVCPSSSLAREAELATTPHFCVPTPTLPAEPDRYVRLARIDFLLLYFPRLCAGLRPICLVPPCFFAFPSLDQSSRHFLYDNCRISCSISRLPKGAVVRFRMRAAVPSTPQSKMEHQPLPVKARVS
ncbi:hypothetical protein EV356DRAFT_260539 [Viridothelium virens]|uniref:Uncharacterized protein n=1 Tax=Viridothelium virens TaxID=1048519 RepID=A0A6A6H328_VIRVR|nr:hypothetical protein EV356DRAFT_260539 [Viridothelium virens]